MRKIFIILLALASVAIADIKWSESYDDAIELAKKQKKHIMVVLSRENCPGCEYMDDVVFEEKAIYNEVNKNFISVHLDINKDFIPDGIGYIGTPTIHFLDSNGKKIGRQDGATNIPNFLSLLGKYKPKK